MSKNFEEDYKAFVEKAEVPDLWNRIEAGLDAQSATVEKTSKWDKEPEDLAHVMHINTAPEAVLQKKKQQKNAKKRYEYMRLAMSVAACAVALLLAIPVYKIVTGDLQKREENNALQLAMDTQTNVEVAKAEESVAEEYAVAEELQEAIVESASQETDQGAMEEPTSTEEIAQEEELFLAAATAEEDTIAEDEEAETEEVSDKATAMDIENASDKVAEDMEDGINATKTAGVAESTKVDEAETLDDMEETTESEAVKEAQADENQDESKEDKKQDTEVSQEITVDSFTLIITGVDEKGKYQAIVDSETSSLLKKGASVSFTLDSSLQDMQLEEGATYEVTLQKTEKSFNAIGVK